MTEQALMDFRHGSGWSAGADLAYALNDQGEMLRADTTTTRDPVIAVVFAQAGFRIGATLQGTKYSRIIP
jgi:lipid-binding SYLF domain-containing protein